MNLIYINFYFFVVFLYNFSQASELIFIIKLSLEKDLFSSQYGGLNINLSLMLNGFQIILGGFKGYVYQILTSVILAWKKVFSQTETLPAR